MGNRKYSAPRRGSMAFRPRARAKSLEARVRNLNMNPSFSGVFVALVNVGTS
jgi:large subunit ribosomal protein L3